MKDLFTRLFFKVFNRETFEKEKFIRDSKVGGVGLLAGLIMGGLIFSRNAEVRDLENRIETLITERNDSLDTSLERKSEIEEKNKTIDELQVKINSASPWFEMKEEERKVEVERLAQEKAQKEAEERAKKEEEQRIAEQERIAKEKAEKEAEAQKYHTGITYEDLARNPVQNISKLVRFKGKILQVMSASGETQYRMAIDSNYDKVVLISVNNEKLIDGNLLENDIVTIEGKFLMETEYTTVMGAKRSIPVITVDNLYR